jgi:hypothetical protein
MLRVQRSGARVFLTPQQRHIRESGGSGGRGRSGQGALAKRLLELARDPPRRQTARASRGADEARSLLLLLLDAQLLAAGVR